MIDWQLVLGGLDYGLESIQSQMFSPDRIISPVWPQAWIFCRGVSDFILSELSSLPPSPLVLLLTTAYLSTVSFKLPCQSFRNVCRNKHFPDLLDPPVSQHSHRHTKPGLVSWALLPLNGSMERCCCRGRASPRQLWCGRSHLWVTKHIYRQSAERAGSGPTSVLLDELHILFWSRCLSGKKRGQRHFLKVRFVSLLFCYHGDCYNLCYSLFSLQFILKFI